MSDFQEKLGKEKERIGELLEEAQIELMKRIAERDDLNSQIVRLQVDIKNMAKVCGAKIEDGSKQLSTTEMVRWVLAETWRTERHEYTVGEIIKRLTDDFNFKPEEYDNANSMIQTVLSRQIKAGDVQEGTRRAKENSKRMEKTYVWSADYTPDMPWERMINEEEIEEMKKELEK
jgi:hypothetical protein